MFDVTMTLFDRVKTFVLSAVTVGIAVLGRTLWPDSHVVLLVGVCGGDCRCRSLMYIIYISIKAMRENKVLYNPSTSLCSF